MLRSRILACALLASAALCAGATGIPMPAYASQHQVTFFEAPSELLNPAMRPSAIAQLKWLGVKALRVELTWGYVAPQANSKTKPSFEATNPGSYYWGQYAALLAEAKRLKWQVLLTVSAPAPRWATSNKQQPYVTNPDDRDFEEFMTAVAREFGSEVSLFAVWNEPNQPAFLRPQFNSKGGAEAPRIYRGLYEAGYSGLRAGGLAKPKVLLGELQPTEKPPKAFKTHEEVELYGAVSPVMFLRETLCINSHWHKAPTCGALQAVGFSIHPYTTAAGPYASPKNVEDVTIGTLGRLVQALGKAAKAHAIKARLPVYITEFGIRTKPERFIGVSPSVQAEWDAICERIAWENPHVASFSQYLLRDDVFKKGPQTGLEKINGQKKPLFYGFAVPLTVTRVRSGVNLWGFVRPSVGRSTTVTVLVQRPHSKHYQVLAKVRTGASGYWKLKSRVGGSYWKVRWTSPTGTKYEGPPIRAYRP